MLAAVLRFNNCSSGVTLVDFERIAESVESFNRFLQDKALAFRLCAIDGNSLSRERKNALESAMIEAANLSIEVEDALHPLMVVRSIVASEWAMVEAKGLASPQYGKWASDKARIAPLMEQNADVYQTLQELNAAIECGVRAVYRLESLQKAASRTLGAGQ